MSPRALRGQFTAGIRELRASRSLGTSIQSLSTSKMSKWWTIRKEKDPGGRSLMLIAKSTDGKQSFLKDLT